jgi:hypothetical protein
MIKLVSIKKSDDGKHKLVAEFSIDGRTKKVKFGSFGMSDYTKHKDIERKERYINRHKTREDWNNPISKGALSYWILWNKPTLSESIIDFKNKFNL